MRMCGLGAVGCLLMIAGCAGTTEGPSPMPAALFLDLVATPQWIDPTPAELSARLASGEVQTLTIFAP